MGAAGFWTSRLCAEPRRRPHPRREGDRPRDLPRHCRRLPDGQAPNIDGKLDEAWATAPAQGNFVQREPSYGAPSTEKTEFRVLYDDKTLYIGVWVWDSDPSAIMGSEMKRDAGLNKGDQLKITIDTFHDHRNAFYFSTNPLGAYKDANTVENGRTINYDWNAVWDNKTSIDDKGWYVEMAIPLSQLRFKTTIGESTWGLNLCRILFRKNEESYWVPFPREWGASGFARVSNAGVLPGLNDIKSRRRIEFVPFCRRRRRAITSRSSEFDTDAKYGGDFKIGLTDDLIADFTYHTDFAQVEADQEVVNLTRFSLFFPEKRQFFTESAGIFDFGKSVTGLGGDAAANDPGLLNIFYSRRIGLVDGQQVPIIGGGRVTGRVGRLRARRAEHRDRGGNARAPASSDNANFTAIRVKRNVLTKSSVGTLIVNSQGGISDYNRTIGIDGGFVLGRYVTMTTVLAKTFSPGATGNDVAGVFDFLLEERSIQLRRPVPRHRRAFQRGDGLHSASRRPRHQGEGAVDAAPEVGRRPAADLQRQSRLLREPRRAGRFTHPERLRSTCQRQDTSCALHRRHPRVRQPDGAVHDGRNHAAGWPVPVAIRHDRLQLGSHQARLWIGRHRSWRLLQRRSPELPRQRQPAGRQDAAVRAELHAQPRVAARAGRSTPATC